MSELVDRNDVGDHQTDELARRGGGPDRPGRGWSFAGFCLSRLPTAVTGSVGLHRPLDSSLDTPRDDS